ncbi:iron reductase [Mycena rosella]|uniref:ferric-chelate reductase (NADPH) n=1 Tax=Mycena rosella TaxID=1033263 RepID=A0AAD7DTX7_MYCRO|nr:iron reductase [Mycena rosella]
MDSSLSNLTVDAQMAAKAASPDKTASHARTYSYPPRVWYFIAAFIALLSLYHFTSMFWSWMRSKNSTSSSSASRGRRSLRRIPVAVLNLIRNTIFRTTLSFGSSYKLNTTELLLSCAYIALLFTWAFVNTTNLEGVELSPQYYANRIGLIAATHKHSCFIQLNIFHRISARVLCVMLWIHGAGHVRSPCSATGRAGNLEDLQETWFRCGILAISSLTLLCILSLQPLRGRAYEAFLVAHFIFAVIFLGAGYYHAITTGTLGYYLWPSLLVWGFDRFLRLVRIFFVNGGALTLFNTKSSHSLRAKIEVISPEFLRVSLRRPDYFRWAPGQLAYLSIPSVSATPWQAHPFTIASIDGDIPRVIESESPSRDESFKESAQELVFLLRVHDGFTKRLLNAATSTNGANKTFGAYIDGPYCSPPSVRGFETVLSFCGTSCLFYTLPNVLKFLRGANMGTNLACRKVIFVWAVRYPEQIRAISDDLLQALDGISDSLIVEIRIHVTASVKDTESDIEKSQGSISTSDVKLLHAPGVQILSGRPDVAGLVKSEVAGASGSISVNVCGTAALRAASSTLDILGGGPSISLHVEAFGM